MDSIKKIAFIVLFLSYHFNAYSQNDSAVRLDKRYLKSYLLDTKDIVISPFKWDKNNFIKAGAVLAFATLAYTQDENIQTFAQRNRTKTVDDISKNFLEPWGSGFYSMPLMGVLYSCGALWHDNRMKKTALLGIKTYSLTGIFVQIPKYTFHRHRPEDNIPPNSRVWEGPAIYDKYTSFPSGHTISVFSVATIIASEYKDKKAIPFIAYAIAGLTAFSRVYDNKHWATDITIGAALGYGMGKLIYNKDNWHKKGKRNNNNL